MSEEQGIYLPDPTPAVARPTVGRIVHYVSYGTPVREDGTQEYASQCRAAIITEVVDVRFVCLAVLSPEGMFFPSHAVMYDPSGAGGSWHWPERE